MISIIFSRIKEQMMCDRILILADTCIITDLDFELEGEGWRQIVLIAIGGINLTPIPLFRQSKQRDTRSRRFYILTQEGGSSSDYICLLKKASASLCALSFS